MITFLAKSLSKLHESPLPNVISYPLYTYFSLSLFFTALFAPNKQFSNFKLLVEFLGKDLDHKQCKRLQAWPRIVLFYP